jgi:rare lipoprotein A (peptidoglycan hydrolase)
VTRCPWLSRIKREVSAADDTRVSFPTPARRRRTTAGLTALICLAALWLSATPAGAEGGGLTGSPAASAPVTPAEIADLDAALTAAEDAADAAAEDLFQAAGQSISVRIAIDEATERAEAAREALTDRVRQIYMTGKPDGVTRVLMGLGDGNGLTSVANAGVRSDRSLIEDVERESKELDRLRHLVATQESVLAKKSRQVSALQDHTLALLTAAQVRYADDQVKLAELNARRKQIEDQALAARQAAAAQQAELSGVTPAVSARGQRAAGAEAPIIASLEAAGSTFPPGYRATGRKLEGKASWYGPGFYGHPTATGAPYDAERFTCAMLAVPLGTVVRVTTDDGKAVNVLVNDRGPYVGGRIIDMSAAGARMLGYSGVRQVTVEVLEPIG